MRLEIKARQRADFFDSVQRDPRLVLLRRILSASIACWRSRSCSSPRQEQCSLAFFSRSPSNVLIISLLCLIAMLYFNYWYALPQIGWRLLQDTFYFSVFLLRIRRLRNSRRVSNFLSPQIKLNMRDHYGSSIRSAGIERQYEIAHHNTFCT